MSASAWSRPWEWAIPGFGGMEVKSPGRHELTENVVSSQEFLENPRLVTLSLVLIFQLYSIPRNHKCDMHHELLTQCALFCIGVNIK